MRVELKLAVLAAAVALVACSKKEEAPAAGAPATSAAKVAGLKTAKDAGSATARPRVRQPDANLDEDAGMSSAPKSCQGP